VPSSARKKNFRGGEEKFEEKPRENRFFAHFGAWFVNKFINLFANNIYKHVFNSASNYKQHPTYRRSTSSPPLSTPATTDIPATTTITDKSALISDIRFRNLGFHVFGLIHC
jgi:hypothetical protein